VGRYIPDTVPAMFSLEADYSSATK
jgi:hypothetical protein